MFGLRSKLLLGFGGLLLIVLMASLLAQNVMDYYSRAIQQSYREDYESVAACQGCRPELTAVQTAAPAVLSRQIHSTVVELLYQREPTAKP